MTLRDKQSVFVRLVASLILKIYREGYEATFGETYRTPEQAALNAAKDIGIAQSLHTKRLAIDLLLFKDGVWLTDSEPYRPFGEWWEALSTPDYRCCWGGHFKTAAGRPKPDGNHFSIEHEGIR